MSDGFTLTVAVHTDVGRVRTNNEDSYGHAWLSDGSLFVIVADGMGGHEAGEVASGLAVQVVEDHVTASSGDPVSSLRTALLEANTAILTEGEESGKLGMGTTAIGAIAKGNQVYVGQIGDSRLYQFRKGHPVWRTLDHTRVQMLVDSGEITEEESRTHPEAGMLTRALGHARMADGRPLEPEVLSDPLVLEKGDALVMCSDGLHDLVEDWEIARVSAGKTADTIAAELVQLACDRGGHDNVTVAVVVAGNRTLDYDANFRGPFRLGMRPGVVPVTEESDHGQSAAGTSWDTPAPSAPPTPIVATTAVFEAPAPVAPSAKRGGRGMIIGAALVAVLVVGAVLLVVLAVVAAFALGAFG